MYVCIKCRKAFKRNPAQISKFNMPDYFYSDGIWERATYVSKLCRKCKDKDFPLHMTEFETIPYDPSVRVIGIQLTPMR